VRREDKLYQEMYGMIPDDPKDRLIYVMGKKANNEKFNEAICKEAKKIKRIKWKTVEFTMWKVVDPARRPRANTRSGFVRMYVPGAAEAGDWFEDFYKENNFPHISTPCKLDIEIYEQTPTSFSMKNKILAELGLIRPWKRTGDFDNYAKTVADSMQHGMLEDDCLVISSTQELYYSCKPHCNVKISYMEKFPEY
jgi:Holliday junction resolvase RusA-like endonuclease